jgi:hypothetical protein
LRLSDNSVSYQTALVFSRILAFLTLSTYYNQVKSLKSYENTTLKKLSHNFLSYGTASIGFYTLCFAPIIFNVQVGEDPVYQP